MHGNKKVILHLVFDGILFDGVYQRFEEMEKYENRYLYGALNNEYNIKYIKNTEKLIRVNSLENWGGIVENPEVDIIYLHGLWYDYLKALDFIRKDVVVMWWCYGMEIYENCFGWPPLLPLRIYKPNTYKFVQSTWKGRSLLMNSFSYRYPNLFSSIKKGYNFMLGRKDDKLRRMLSRIDFAFTPLETELIELKKRHPYIKAKPFRLQFISQSHVVKESMEVHKYTGNVLLEHSANISNNHLDIIAVIKEKKLNFQDRDIFIPLSYGDERLAESVKKESYFNGAQVHCLTDILPVNDYNEMLSSCTHALFGMIRQSGLGNIYKCFKKGIKVFFFKDSILYKQFKAEGYYVFTIENDLSDDAIREPLSPDQALHNYNKYYSRWDASIVSLDEQFDIILKNNNNDKY